MVRNGYVKRVKRQVDDNKKQFTVLLLLIGLITALYLSTNGQRFSAYISGVDAPILGDISYTGMSVESERIDVTPSGEFTLNFDGVPVWTDYLANTGTIDTQDYEGLVGAPKCMPSTSWGFGGISHIDLDQSNPLVIEDGATPSGFTITDGQYYTEIYRYIVNVVVRVHADMNSEVGLSTYPLDFADLITSNWYESHYIGEYAPMREVYSYIGINTQAQNSSIILTGTDLAAVAVSGELEYRFWRWSSNPTWDQSKSWNLNQLFDDIEQNIAVGVNINRDVSQSGFDLSQGFNIVEITPGANSYYEFQVGFNYLAVPGYYYNYYKDVFFFQEKLQLYDVEVTIPVAFQVGVVYDLPAEQIDDLYDLYPDLKNPGGYVYITGTSAIPDNSTWGTRNPDNVVVNVLEGIPGFDFLYGYFGDFTYIVMVAGIGVGGGYLLLRKSKS